MNSIRQTLIWDVIFNEDLLQHEGFRSARSLSAADIRPNWMQLRQPRCLAKPQSFRNANGAVYANSVRDPRGKFNPSLRSDYPWLSRDAFQLQGQIGGKRQSTSVNCRRYHLYLKFTESRRVQRDHSGLRSSAISLGRALIRSSRRVFLRETSADGEGSLPANCK
jgi:hypothetical protein